MYTDPTQMLTHLNWMLSADSVTICWADWRHLDTKDGFYNPFQHRKIKISSCWDFRPIRQTKLLLFNIHCLLLSKGHCCLQLVILSLGTIRFFSTALWYERREQSRSWWEPFFLLFCTTVHYTFFFIVPIKSFLILGVAWTAFKTRQLQHWH